MADSLISLAATGAASPRARRLARELGVDLGGLRGSGPAGRIIERDIRAALAPADEPAAPVLAAPAAQVGFRFSLQDSRQAVPLQRQSCLELDCEIDAADALRAQLRATARAGESEIDLVDCALRAFALALKASARAHLAYREGGFIRAESCDIGLALDGRAAAPTLRAVELLSLSDIAGARRALAAAPATEDSGGSALLIDAGALGVRRLFPALSPPWTAILALGAVEPRVVVRAGVLAIARVTSVTLTFDSRAIAAADAGAALRLFKMLMENPARLAI